MNKTPHSSIPSHRDIAREVGCSHTTVSLALKGHPKISDATKQQVLEAAEKLGYRRDPFIQAFVSRLTKRSHAERAEFACIYCIPYKDMMSAIPKEHRQTDQILTHINRMGYSRVEFDPFEPSAPQTPEQVLNILHTRNIHGVMLINAFDIEHNPWFDNWPWDRFTTVTVSGNLKRLHLINVTTDVISAGLKVLEECQNRGYRRIGISISKEVNRLSDNRWQMFIHHTSASAKAKDRIPAYQETRWDQKAFMNWVRRTRPEVILSTDPHLVQVLREEGLHVPEDIAFAVLGLSRDQGGLSGSVSHSISVGNVALEVLDAQLLRNERGFVSRPRNVIIRPTWHEGETLPYRTER